MKSWPSRSATIGTNNCPGAKTRESIAAEVTVVSGPISSPPVAAAMSLAVKCTLQRYKVA
ncbi:hypothetical protein GOEFS_106_00480 [Gordonia effusa NBRC 100432]|uniref:Uncharacterized protein n=1 Tax=Gordonia effusa NBRC 100432 TaxID=1077974 RepID=H0R501_9ACTN|nr:hypothetical protein GOEFS_106_00480 [Gordonia effusa NBRC 100432]